AGGAPAQLLATRSTEVSARDGSPCDRRSLQPRSSRLNSSRDMPVPSEKLDAAAVARHLAAALDARRQEYALGGAIALGYWATPRGTVGVDLTLFLPPEKHSACVWLLQDLGCKLTAAEAMESLRERKEVGL